MAPGCHRNAFMHTARVPPMTVLIVHYHLRAGGVTRVIHAQVSALKSLGHRIVVASAGPAEEIETETILEPSLDYQREGRVNAEPLLAIKADLWIIHNPTLGKNAGFPELIETAAQCGAKILLQCHDFAEDGRPGNYGLFDNIEHLYPVAPHIHYAFINRRDQQLLREAGLPKDSCQYLPNAVVPPKISTTKPDGLLVFYPVRGIRRKNLGELCLLAAHAPEGVKFAVALAPENREWMEIHDQWASFASELGLPVEFNVVSDSDFPQWMARATHIVTTSIAEGFGLTFLEPAFLGKPLIGRNLPEITSDFPSYGTLYDRLPVSVDHLEDSFKSALSRCWQIYGHPPLPAELEEAWEYFLKTADFGNLPEDEQRRIILGAELPGLREWLSRALSADATEIDLEPWSIENYGVRLAEVIEGIGEPGPVSWLDKKEVLNRFLAPTRFHFLRS